MTPDTPPTPTDALAAIRQRLEAIHGFEHDREFLAELDENGTWAFWARLPYSTKACEFIAHAPADIRTLLAALAAHEQREARLREALQELYNATRIVERQNPVATEDWHHDLFAATGNASAVLHETKEAMSTGGGDDAR